MTPTERSTTLTNFTVPEALVNLKEDPEERKTDKFGVIGFTLSRGNSIFEGSRSNPHVCQLHQVDQGLDALFFVFDFSKEQLVVIRSGAIQSINLCPDLADCPNEDQGVTPKLDPTTPTNEGLLAKINSFVGKKSTSAPDYNAAVPLLLADGQYSAHFAIKFSKNQRGLYHLMYHNCFNYKAHGYSDRVAVDFTASIVEKNIHSYLSAGDIPKPQLYLYVSFLFALCAIVWINTLCKSDSKNVYRVHKLMVALVILKVLSSFFHGINFYFVSVYGHQREFWAVVYYVTHLLKGAILFGTIILIGTGYTFFKNFLTDRDRNLFMFVLPLQIVDNIVMVIIEESEFGEQRYYFWFEIFVFLDLVCCMAIIFPVVWSMRHLQEGAKTDGKAAFNLEKLRLFRQFYVIVISYIYLTRVTKFLVELVLPFNYQWVSEAIVELSTLFFFCVVGSKFRPIKSNPYLRVSQDSDDDEESGVALTNNGLFENVTRVQRISVQDELDDIPGGIGGRDSDDDAEDDSLLPKTGRDMALSHL
ncbi:seven transmembrane receptor family protein [Aphelenchoides avenae]|nr:seven transmembrane receptor family protein [Aphelenchus avenae]